MTQDPEEMQVLDALGRVVPQVAPPPDLRARVLAAAAREPHRDRAPTFEHPLPFQARTPEPVVMPRTRACHSLAVAAGGGRGVCRCRHLAWLGVGAR